MFCKDCGNRVVEGSKFCVICGASLKENTVSQNNIVSYSRKNVPAIDEYMEQTTPTPLSGIVKNIFFFLVVTAILLVIGRIIGYVL